MNATMFLRLAVSLSAGAIFGFGLALSGMIDPARVLGFLNLAGRNWDPSLMFVLGGALVVAVPGVAIQRRMHRPFLDQSFHLPESNGIDGRLVTGAALFGIGWGIAGLCPGPAVSALSLGLAPVVVFVAAMAAGMMLHDRVMTAVRA